jgi:acyl dehydratase
LPSELDAVESVAYLEEQREFAAPTYPGDEIQATWRVEESRPSRSRPGTGVVRLAVEVVNQAGEVVQRGHDVWLVARRPEGAS